ncbi:SPX-domain-containing protein [Neolentinus lepideus HHB14362 ss-1]|uniref:Vacuolar transporter chaperone complex subunit 4 n=1 Tax=Neolentinus lepideus HHB14362 ss-1 TaxID=1314782 RepID=A0A165VL65_9AGAM|nr:SPX-domain-containing protein [Neolentinus lepideus HHB14362 ss-1]
MKFGKKINNDLYGEWRPFYIDYNRLKRELKAGWFPYAAQSNPILITSIRTTSRGWTEDDEKDFKTMLEQELDKIHDFQKQKTFELSRRIRDAERVVKRLVEEPAEDVHHVTRTHDAEAQQREAHTHDMGSDDDDDDDDDESDDLKSLDALEDQFHELEEEVATLVADVHDLALYSKLNITGFMKILKKHDKQTNMPLKPTFVTNYLEKRPFYKYNWDALIVKLSKLYDLVRTRGHPVLGDPSAGGSQSAFVRQTTKYWVHPDNLVHLKLAILKHLPVLVFNPDKEFEAKDAAITSIYFDNEDLELYLGRLEKTEGAEAIRLRWYGDMDVKTIFVERKTHREDWTGEKSVKARFPIKEDKVNAFLRGEYIMDEEFQELVKKGKKTQQEVDGMIQLANEVQYTILTKKLYPVMRTFYNRTAFQLPGDARVRISLDTELTMVREDNWDGCTRSGDNWRRMDIGIDYPFEQVPTEDKELFKYGVLEVKLQTQYGQEPPEWVTDLVQSHLVEAVPKFSKFVHGCATLLPERVDLIPFWLPQMDMDITKPATGTVRIERPTHVSYSKDTSAHSSSGVATPEPDAQHHAYTEPVSEGEEDEERDLAPAKDEDKRTGLTGAQVAEAAAIREKHLKERHAAITINNDHYEADGDADIDANERMPFLKGRRPVQAPTEDPNKARALSINPLAPSNAFDETFRTRLQQVKTLDSGQDDSALDDDEQEEPAEGPSQPQRRGSDRELVRHWTAPSGKRIAVPVRIEPKVYFASERTFLKWLHFAVLIGTIATTLLNFVDPSDVKGIIGAGAFTIAALLAIAYSAVIFVYRTHRLRQRSAEGLYYDKYGPTILCIVLFSAMATNMVLQVGDTK